MVEDVVVLGGTEWAEDVNHTPQQMARAASRNRSRRVLYVGRRAQGSLLRRAFKGELKAITPSSLRHNVSQREGLTVYEVGGLLSILPLCGAGWWEAVQVRNLDLLLRRAMKIAGMRPESTTLLLYWWQFPSILDRLPWKRIVFDVIDDHAAIGGNRGRRKWNSRMERLLAETAERAPAVTAVTKTLAATLRNASPLPVAFDFVLADRTARSATPPPVHHPAVGYAGGVDTRIDWNVVSEVVSARPQWSFYFLGGHPPMSLGGNVFSFGNMPYGTILSALRRMDAAWIPFVVDRLTQTSDFLKTWDYRFAELPVVATALPSTERAASIDGSISLVRSGDACEWLRHLEDALKHGRAPLDAAVRVGVSTDRRLERLLQLARPSKADYAILDGA